MNSLSELFHAPPAAPLEDFQPPRPLSEAEQNLARLERIRVEVVKPFYDEYEAALAAVGLGNHFQDPSGIVHFVDKPRGGWVNYPELKLRRTRYSKDESAPSLGAEEARRFGYTVEGKAQKPEKTSAAPENS